MEQPTFRELRHDFRGEIHRLQRRLLWSWILLVLLIAVLGWPLLRSWLELRNAGEPRPVTPRGELAEFEQTTSELFDAASPSVVYINTRSRVADPWTRRVMEVESGTGSGFVWDEAGHIVTNYHVIQKASSAKVVFYDQSSYDAQLVGASPEHDLAVLRIRTSTLRLRPVLVGESRGLRVGQAVFAIGNPFGLSQTLTTGVVSARSRTILGPVDKPIDDVIQIDAAINPGNSGGPLLDSAGRLIGVNTAIYSPSGTSAGVGFAVPVDTVNRVVPRLIAMGRYEPPRLGIRVDDHLSATVTSRLGIQGVLVLQVEPGSPAERAGFRETKTTRNGELLIGDVIQRIGEQDVVDLEQLLKVLERHQPGDRISVSVFREGTELTIDVTL